MDEIERVGSSMGEAVLEAGRVVACSNVVMVGRPRSYTDSKGKGTGDNIERAPTDVVVASDT